MSFFIIFSFYLFRRDKVWLGLNFQKASNLEESSHEEFVSFVGTLRIFFDGAVHFTIDLEHLSDSLRASDFLAVH